MRLAHSVSGKKRVGKKVFIDKMLIKLNDRKNVDE